MVTRETFDTKYKGIYIWPREYHPTSCDVLIMAEELERLPLYTYDRLYMTLNRIDPELYGHAGEVDGYVMFSDFGVRATMNTRPGIKPEQCFVISPGVHHNGTGHMNPHHALWANSPDRGLIHIARWWDRVVDQVPDATIFLTYRLEDYMEQVRYMHDQVAIDAREIMDWVQRGRGVVGLGPQPRDEVLRLQRNSGLYIYPCAPMHQGELTTAFAVYEAAAAGMHILLSDADALPEEFGEIATILGSPGEWNYDDWVSEVVAHMTTDPVAFSKVSRRNRTWAGNRSWRKNGKSWVGLVERNYDAPRSYASKAVPVMQGVASTPVLAG